MLFNSLEFLVFLPIVLVVYFIIPVKIRYLWLLAASYYFYMCWNAKYILLILTSTIITYLSGLVLEAIKKSSLSDGASRFFKNLTVAASFISNLGILFYFKYSNFAMESLALLFARLHIELNVPVFDIVLPVGISFYTFQALSYTMDVYRDEIYAEKNFFRYALFVSFFPQLVAGPIERSKNLLKQLAVPKAFSFDNFREGVLLMIWGYFLKIVLADRISIFVDTVYGNYAKFEGYYIVLATVLFAFQIYCDFYGYSTIAMGSAKILGIQLMENFNAPYLSPTVATFWRNWHISLTSWFKDYLYIPLGGSRKGKFRKYLNKLIVFLVSGLWHGASFTFVISGALNGIYQIIGEILMPARKKLRGLLGMNDQSVGFRIFQTLLTFVMVDFSWIFFRAQTIREALAVVYHMITVKNYWILFDNSRYQCGLNQRNFWLMINCIVILLFADYLKSRGIAVRKVIMEQDIWVRWVIYIFAIFAVMLFGKWGPAFDQANFIYFQF